jgi:hypothetical protein
VRYAPLLCLLVAGVALTAGVGSSHSAGRDPPALVEWHRVGDISLGESQRQVFAEYGGIGHGYHREVDAGILQGYFRVHGTDEEVDFRNHRVDDILFSTRYYRTRSGFGVGSKIPFGPCVKTWTHRCGHRWHGFVWNEVYKEHVCSCWAKVGTGKQSLRPAPATFGRRWVLVYVSHGRVAGFYLSRHFVD